MTSSKPENILDDQKAVLQAFARALGREAHVLADHPELLWQQMYNRMQWEEDTTVERLQEELLERSRLELRPWLKCTTPYRESQSLLRTINTQSYLVFSCAFSPLGDSIFCGDEEGVIQVYQTTTGKQELTIDGKKKTKGYYFSPDGKTIKTICQDGSIQVFETHSGWKISTLQVRSNIDSSAFSKDGRLVLTHHDNALILWNAETGEPVSVLDRKAEYVQACSFSPDGRYVATTGGLDNQLNVWNAVSGEKLYTSDKRYKLSRYTCNFSPDGKLIVTDRAIWETATGRLIHQLWGHRDVVSSCVFSPDGRFVASTGWDQTVRVWSVDTGKKFATFTGHSDWVMACAFSLDGQSLISASNDETIRVWTLPTEPMEEEMEEDPGGLQSCGYSPDGKLIAAGYGKGQLVLFDGETGAPLRTKDLMSNPVTSVAFSPDSRYIACGGNDWVLEVRDTKTLEKVTPFELDGDTRTLDCNFSPDGKYLVASDPKGFEVMVWDFQSKDEEIFLTFDKHKIVPNICRFSPDGSWIASGDWDSNLLIWEAATGKVLHEWVGQTGSVNCCSFSPDGKQIVSGNEDGSIKRWSLESGELIDTLKAHKKFVSSCAFSPDGSLVISTGEDTVLKVFDAVTYDLLAQISLTGKLNSLGVHPFKPILVCGDANGTLYRVELVGIDFGPIFLTPTLEKGQMLIRCPSCRKETRIDRKQPGTLLTCSTPGCGLSLILNTFILGGMIDGVQEVGKADDIDRLREQLQIHQTNHEMDQALETAERILELQEFDPEANIARLSILVQFGRYDEAIQTGEHCIQENIVDRENPGKVYLLMGMANSGNSALGPERYDSAIDWLEKSLELQETSQAWLQIGMAQATTGEGNLALRSYLKARTLQSESEKDQIDLAIGFTHIQMNHAQLAESEFRNTLDRGNQDPLASFGLGLSLVLGGKASQSLPWFKRFLKEARPEHQGYAAQAKMIVDKLSSEVG